MIPKIIHYCWLSDDPIPDKYMSFINDWQKIMPDYKIKKWDRKAINLDEHPFAKHAFEAGKYAFAADYIRVYALYTEGGIYLDSDVRVLKPFDKFLSFDYFTSYENHWSPEQYKLLFGRYIDKQGNRLSGIHKILNVGLQAAVVASIPQHPYIKELWNYYKSLVWEKWVTETAPTVHARIGEQFGLKYLDRLQLLGNNIAIFPSDVFCSNGCNQITDNTHAIHVCNGSWITEKNNFVRRYLKKNGYLMSMYLKYKIIAKKQK